jgi:hypothetical protein
MVAQLVETDIEQQRDALLERLIGSANGLWDNATVYLGDRLGLYRRLAEIGTATSTELADACGLSERYVREWLEQQTTAGILTLENPGAGALERKFA